MADFKSSTLRKILAGSLAVLMLTSSYAALPMLSSGELASITVNAADTTFTVGSLQYTILSDTQENEVSVYNVVKDDEGNYPTSVTVPATVENEGTTYTVTTIGSNAFSSAPSYYTLGKPDFKPESIVLPDTLKTIKSNAFRFTTVPSLVVPASVTSIEGTVFGDAKTSVIEIKGDLTFLGTSAFSSSEVTEVIFDGSVPKIDQNTFHSCKQLKSIVIPEGCTSIEYNAFKYCTALKSVVMPSTMRFIYNRTSAPDRAFEGCDNLLVTENGGVYAGNALIRTDDNTLPENGVLTIKEGTVVIAQGALSSSKIKEVVFPASYTALSHAPFGSLTMDRLVIPSTLIPEGSTTYDRANLYGLSGVNELVVQSAIEELKPYSISFYQGKRLVLPETLKTIDGLAMYGVRSDFVQFPASLKTIGSSDNSSSRNTFRSLSLPAGLESIGTYFYNYKESNNQVVTDSIVMPLSLYNAKPEIDDNAFSDTQNTPLFITGTGTIDNNTEYYTSKKLGNKYLFIQEGINTAALDNANIGYAVFRKNDTNKTIEIISVANGADICSFKDQNDFAFDKDYYTISYVNEAAYTYEIVDDSYVRINKYNNAIAGETVNVPSTLGGKPVQAIGTSAFLQNPAADIVLPATVTAIGDSAFKQCTAITAFTAPSELTSIGTEAFSGCTALASVTFNDALKVINESAFSGCTALTDVSWNQINNAALTDIGCFAFNGCSGLTYLNIPSSLTSAGAILGTSSLPSGFLNLVIYDNMADVASKSKAYSHWTPNTGTYETYTEYQPVHSSASPKAIVVLKSDVQGAVLGAKPFGDYSGFYMIEEGVALSEDFKKNNNYFYVTKDDQNKTLKMDLTKPHGHSVSSINTDTSPDCVIIDETVYRIEHTFYKADTISSTCTVKGCEEHYEDEFGKAYYYEDEQYTAMNPIDVAQITLPLDYSVHNFDSTTGECVDCHKKFSNNIGAITGNSLNLDATIGLNFYVTFDTDFYGENSSTWTDDETGTEYKECFMRFTFDNGKIIEQPLSYATSIGSTDGSIQYKFQCPVDAKNMQTGIKAELCYGDGTPTGVEQQYSVASYCNYILSEPENWGETLVALADAMINYGSYAQQYFGVDTDKTYTPGAALKTYLDGIKAEYTEDYGYEPEAYFGSPFLTAQEKMAYVTPKNLPVEYTDTENVKFVGANLSLTSETVLRLYFEIADTTGFYYKENGSYASYTEFGKAGKYYYIEVPLSPKNVLDTSTYLIYTDADGDNMATVSYSVTTYIDQVISRPETATRTPALKSLMKALYVYSSAAQRYFVEFNPEPIYVYP